MFTINSTTPSSEVMELADGNVTYYPRVFSKEESDRYLEYLLNDIPWQRDKITIFGKECLLPRDTAWFGDEGMSYTYSGITMNPRKWTDELYAIKSKIEEYTPATFNSLLLNKYNDGNDHVSWHADDEKDLGDNVVVGSVSFGVRRDFQLKHKYKKEIIDGISFTLIDINKAYKAALHDLKSGGGLIYPKKHNESVVFRDPA